MRATINRKAFAEWVEQRLESDNGFTIEFFNILNWFEQGEIKSIPRLPITKMLMVTALVARIKLYPVKAISMEQYMKHLITWENETMYHYSQKQYKKHYQPSMFQDKRRPFLEAFNTYIDNYIYGSWKDVFALEFIHADAIKKKKNLLTYQSINI